ncbi:MAG: ECF transporter S component [Rubrobacter sp.]|nr:ECF transporter S component [Rubrobacter sp.]MBA3951202.1 ECF transporter S component [Rubrobacter sp.]MDQ3360396.1 ECF transporter S component [Actinomycetota bacterium]
MASNAGGHGGGSASGFGTRQVVVAGVVGGVALFLGATRLGLIPVPIPLIGNATIMHIPAIVGGVLEGPVVGILAGLIFGIFSFLYAESPVFANPLVAILPRLLIGVVAWAVFVSLRRFSVDLASVAAGLLGSLANTVGVVSLAVLFGLLPLSVVPVILPQAIAEAVLAAVVTVVVVRGVMLFRSGRTTAPEVGSDQERRY